MGQNNLCCHFAMRQSQFNLNEVQIHWPNVADDIAKLRQDNKNVQSVMTQRRQSRNYGLSKNIYNQFITAKYCFFGYVSQSHRKSSNQLRQSISSSSISLKSNKRKQSKKQKKQNNLSLQFLPQRLQLNDFGVLIQRQKACYVGYFRDNKFQGRGFMSNVKNQETFQGIFENGIKVNGTFQNQNIKYTGQFKRDQIEGHGKIQFKQTNHIYQGYIFNGRMHGKGKITYQNGDCYRGQFENGLYNGQGEYSWSTGQKFKGTYKKGKKHGFGIISVDGTVHQICWVNDKAQAKPLKCKQFQRRKQIRILKSMQSNRSHKSELIDEQVQLTSIVNHKTKAIPQIP